MIKKRTSGLPPKPTTAELGILRVLWDLGNATVREVHEAVSKTTGTGYTTVLKFLQIMHQKGLVERDDSQRAHVYRPAVSKKETQRLLTEQLVQGVFNGRYSQLVLHALGEPQGTTPEELAEIRTLLEQLESKCPREG